MLGYAAEVGVHGATSPLQCYDEVSDTCICVIAVTEQAQQSVVSTQW